MSYEKFINKKVIRYENTGFHVKENDLNPVLYKWQKILVQRSLSIGRSALLEDCGLGKTLQQAEWAYHVNKHTKKPILIIAPLAVSRQTKELVKKMMGYEITICKDKSDIKKGLNITNYERIEKFDPSIFGGVVLDESSILKNFEGKTKNLLVDMFANTQYKLCCSATPAPNDFTEIGNTAEFLNVMTRSEMLSMFFINDTGDTTAAWRLMGHAKKNVFWKWLASWAVMLQKPSDIGFSDKKFTLPKLNIEDKIIPYTAKKNKLVVMPAKTLTDRRKARNESLEDRCKLAAKIVNESDDIWIVWCGLNKESEELKNRINDSFEIRGGGKDEYKENTMMDFQNGKIKCLITKPTIAGMGMNFQICHNMIFVGLSDSFEQYYQAVRRCWRYGQEKEVNVYIIIGEKEGAVSANIKRKEKNMEIMFSNMIENMQIEMKQNIRQKKIMGSYSPEKNMIQPHF